jgi:hypothetical protein
MDKKEPVPAGGFTASKTAPKGLEKSYFPVSQCADLGSGKELGLLGNNPPQQKNWMENLLILLCNNT